VVVAPLKFTALYWVAFPFWAMVLGHFPARPFIAAAALPVLVALIFWAWARRSPLAGEKSAGEKHGSPSAGEKHAEEVTALGQITLWLGATYLLSGLVYGTLLDDPQFWHLSVPSLILFLLLASWGAQLTRQRLALRAQMRLGAVVFVAALGLCLVSWERMQPAYPWQRDVYTYQPRFETLVPATAEIGCFDAGIPAYFSPRRIINLDGLVNHTAVSYWKAGTLDRYVAARGIRYIANDPGTVAHAQKFTISPIPLTLMATSPLTKWYTPERCLWKVGVPPIKEKEVKKVSQTP